MKIPRAPNLETLLEKKGHIRVRSSGKNNLDDRSLPGVQLEKFSVYLNRKLIGEYTLITDNEGIITQIYKGVIPGYSNPFINTTEVILNYGPPKAVDEKMLEDLSTNLHKMSEEELQRLINEVLDKTKSLMNSRSKKERHDGHSSITFP